MTLSATRKHLTAKPDEGGYYAIKGFLYQFDKTLIEVLSNPNTTIRFENRQDIDYEDFVLQVKHKETQNYAPSKIRKAVKQLMAFFVQDPTRRLCLYCHFKDKGEHTWTPTLAEIDILIGRLGKKLYPLLVREQFIASFKIRFSEDYKNQFEKTLALIKSSFSLPSKESAVLHHCIFQSKLMKLSLGPRPLRMVRFEDLRSFLDDAEVRLFEGAYSKYVSDEKYVRLIKKMFFTATTPNIENFERLFLVECDSVVSQTDLIKIAAQLSSKFYKKGKSPQPYIVFRKLPKDHIAELKRTMLDGGIHFFDGTHFDGDRFRADELAGTPVNSRKFTLKVVPEEQIQQFIKYVQFKEVFQFFVREPVDLGIPRDHRRIQVKKTAQVLQMII
jgi:hypothetical protein